MHATSLILPYFFEKKSPPNIDRPRIEATLGLKINPKIHNLPYFFEYRPQNNYGRNLEAAACNRRNTVTELTVDTI